MLDVMLSAPCTARVARTGTDLEGGLIAPSLKMMSDGLHAAVARGEEMTVEESSIQAVLAFAAKCAKGAAFDKVGRRLSWFRFLLTPRTCSPPDGAVGPV